MVARTKESSGNCALQGRLGRKQLLREISE
jgi:hypothetical protein